MGVRCSACPNDLGVDKCRPDVAMAARLLHEGYITPTAQQQLCAVGMDEVVTTCRVETGADHRRFPIAIRIRECPCPSGTAKSVFDFRTPAVLCYFPKRSYQVFITRHLFHRHRRQGLSGCGSRLRHRIPGWGCGLARPSPGNGPLRAVGCLEKQIPLACLFTGRGRLPSPLAVSGSDRLSTAFRYCATI